MSWDDKFICAICKESARDYYASPSSANHRVIPPICMSCEKPSVYSWNGRGRSVGIVKDGSFGDRRMARRLYAIADALECTANRMIWERQHG